MAGRASGVKLGDDGAEALKTQISWHAVGSPLQVPLLTVLATISSEKMAGVNKGVCYHPYAVRRWKNLPQQSTALWEGWIFKVGMER